MQYPEQPTQQTFKSTNSFTSFTMKNTFKIYHESNYRKKKIIYLLESTHGQKQYVGKSELLFILD